MHLAVCGNYSLRHTHPSLPHMNSQLEVVDVMEDASVPNTEAPQSPSVAADTQSTALVGAAVVVGAVAVVGVAVVVGSTDTEAPQSPSTTTETKPTDAEVMELVAPAALELMNVLLSVEAVVAKGADASNPELLAAIVEANNLVDGLARKINSDYPPQLPDLTLSIAKIEVHLGNLDAGQLRSLRKQEVDGKNRKTLLQKLDRLLK